MVIGIWYLQVLLITNKATLNIHGQVFVWTYVSLTLGEYLQVELPARCTSLCSSVLETAKQLSKVMAQFWISARDIRVKIVLPPHQHWLSSVHLIFRHSGHLLVTLTCISLMTSNTERLFPSLSAICKSSFVKCHFSFSACFFNLCLSLLLPCNI